MKHEGFEGISPIQDADPFNVALKRFDDSRQYFLSSAVKWAQLPNEERTEVFEDAEDLYLNTFKKVAEIIINDPTMEVQQKAVMITGIIKESDTARVETFNEFAPYGNFVDSSKSFDDLAEQIESDFEDENGNREDNETIFENLEERFMFDHDLDVNWLKIKVSQLPKTKNRLMRDGLYKQMAGIGKIAAGALIANVVYGFIKKESE